MSKLNTDYLLLRNITQFIDYTHAPNDNGTISNCDTKESDKINSY